MLLKSLQLQGFKSFPDKTVLQFDQGATVVVGPNGSGKSNIADAMKWVLGELSTKNLRGSKMEDVIFGGSDSRGPMSFSEVSVTFDNSGSDGTRLASDYDEVTVTRRYYRAGESEYMINRTPCRLKDIVELFMNTGIGREGYSIIGQGKIAEIISQKSEERRHVFEEAAGISKYKYKKNEAEKKLLAVTDNLDRVSDILAEITTRIGPLERDAEKAKIYLSLYEDKKKTDVSLWLYDMDVLMQSIADSTDACTLSQNEYDRQTEALEELEKQSEHLYALSSENKQEIDRLAAQIAALNEEKLRLESECRLLENEIAHIEERLSSNTADSAGQDAYRQDEELQLAHAREMLCEMEADCETARAACDTDSAAIADCDRQVDETYNLATVLDEEAETLSQKVRELAVSVSVLETNKTAEKQRRGELEETAEKCRADMALLTERSARAAKAVEAYEARIEEIRAAAKAHTDAIAALNTQKEAQSAEQNRLFVAYTSKKERMDALGRMDELFEGYSRSVRAVMQAYERGQLSGAKLHGPLSKLISVEARYTTAIETALGANIQNIVVADDRSAKAAIRYLKETNGGRATFYPLNTITAQYLHGNASDAAKMKGYCGIASELVACDDAYRVVVDSLLARTMICDNIDNATAIARLLSFKVRVVTLDGQVINAGGSFTGGSLKHDSGMLSRASEIAALKADCETLSAKLDAVKKEIDRLTSEADAHRDQSENGQVDLEMIITLAQAEKTQQQVIDNQLESDNALLAGYETEIERLEADSGQYAETRAAYERQQAELETQIAENKQKQQDNIAHRTALSKQMNELQKQRGQHQIALAEANKDAQVYHNAVALHTENIEKSAERFRSIATENETLAETKQQHEAEIAAKTAEAEARGAELAACEESRARLVTDSGDFEQKAAHLRGEIRDGNHTKELLFQQLTVATAKKEGALAEQDKKTSALWEEYELTYSTAQALSYPAVTADTRAEAVREQNRMRAQMKGLGHVNVGAIDEYTEVKERYDFLTAQVEDLNTSKQDLSEIIYQLEGEMRKKFTEAMRDINREFKNVFVELFGGGHAELILSEPDNVLESGVEIVVAPPGKIIKNLMLLSGGEQAFVAIALYFALQKVNPAPFCILDEIEAALDEVNVDKFANYLKRHSDRTQFIVITHRRGTMEMADRLYGVTMYEKGISVVLSINANEVGNFIN